MKFPITLYTYATIFHCLSLTSSSLHNEEVGNYGAIKSTILSLIEFNLNLQSEPKTVRCVTLNATNSTIQTNHLYDNFIHSMVEENFQAHKPNFAFLIGNNKPFLDSPDENSITTGGIRGKIERLHYIAIIFVSHSSQVSLLVNIVDESVNKRHDRAIFVGHTQAIIQELSSSEIIQGVRDKHFICVENEPTEIFTDPLIFDKSNKLGLISVLSTADLPIRKKMGGLLRGRHFKTGQSEVFHWAYIQSQEKDGSVQFGGSFVKVQTESMKRFNYTLEIELLDTYASFVNGTWEGSTGCVLNGECDLSICLSPEYLWGSQMDFSPWLDTARLIFWTNYPRKDPKWYGFLLPFSPIVWACLFFTFVLFGFILLTIMFIKENFRWTKQVFQASIQLPFAVLVEQDIPQVPTGLTRYLLGMWLFAAIIITTGYKSTLRTNLMFPPEDIVPLTHPELADRNDYKSTLYSFGELELEHFRSSTDRKILQISRRLRVIPDREECLHDVVLNYKQTCSSWYPPSAMLIARNLTLSTLFDPLIPSKDHIALSYMTLAFPKNSIFVDSFSEIISAFSETGIYLRFAEEEANKLKKDGVDYWKMVKDEEKGKSAIYQVLKRQLAARDESDTKPLTFTSLCVVFLFIPFGGIVAFIVYVMEKRWFILGEAERKKCLL